MTNTRVVSLAEAVHILAARTVSVVMTGGFGLDRKPAMAWTALLAAGLPFDRLVTFGAGLDGEIAADGSRPLSVLTS